jgi:pyruvate dehydrogenase E1 component alpha subunit
MRGSKHRGFSYLPAATLTRSPTKHEEHAPCGVGSPSCDGLEAVEVDQMAEPVQHDGAADRVGEARRQEGNTMQLNRESLLKAWRDMVTIRRFEERVQDEFSKGGIPGFVHLYAGQEASAVGVCAHLGPGDRIASTHRGHGHSIAKGCDVTGMMLELFAKQGGLCGGKGGSMHIADLDQGMLGANGIVGGGPPLVVGAALTAKTLRFGNVAVALVGDGGSNQGTTFEAMNLAVVLKLPAIFVFENNGYGEYTGASYAVGCRDIAGRAGGFGMPAAKLQRR